MNVKTKAITVIITSVVICMLIYSPLSQATQTDVIVEDELTLVEIEESEPEVLGIRSRVKFALWFLKHAKATEIEGSVMALVQKKLILNSNEELIRINMPGQWIVENQVMTLTELFEDYLGVDEKIAIKALVAEMIDKEDLRIYILAGYEVVTDSGVKAVANLKVNIED